MIQTLWDFNQLLGPELFTWIFSLHIVDTLDWNKWFNILKLFDLKAYAYTWY